MICKDCRARKHNDCKSGTWCDCQHRPLLCSCSMPDGAMPCALHESVPHPGDLVREEVQEG